MHPIVRNILAVIAGWLGGSVLNMGLVKIGHIVTPVEGVDLTNMNEYAEVMPTLSAEHFIFPFLAHSLGTMAGAIIAGLVAANNNMKFSLAIGALFLLGGIMVSFMLPAPTWFVVVDLLIAYIPMDWIGGKIALKISASK